MSNLKLPEMDYYTLRQIADNPDSKVVGEWIKLAYQTFILRDGAHVLVKHHDTVIADISQTEVKLYHEGFHSPTTANRLNRILYANCGHHVGLKDRTLQVRYPNTGTTAPLLNGDRFYTKG